MPVEALNTAVPRDNDGNRFTMRIDKRSGHRFLADCHCVRHRHNSF
tara:strand:- start:114 stop:251 length:138 start_codon:yes stop_codon:yes gene_type:complete